MNILLGALGVLVLLVLAISLFYKKDKKDAVEEPVIIPDADCCGAHEVCESDLPANMNAAPVYYDDEELDRFKDRSSDNYEDIEEDEFMDVFLTLRERDISGWIKSLQIRNIELPKGVREQAVIVLAELREKAV